MRSILLAAALVMCTPMLAMATIVEVPPDDYLIWNAGVDPAVTPGDIIQTATAPHPEADRVLLVWTVDRGTGPRDIEAGVVEPNIPSGEALVTLDDTEAYVRDPAVAFDAGTGQWLIVWSQENSPGEYEVFGRLMYVDGTLNPAPFRITTTGTNDLDPAFDALQPSVSSNDAGTFLVAWAADDDAVGLPNGGFEIFHRTLNAQTEALGPVVQVSNLVPIGGASIQPQLGYLYSTDSWVVLWEGDATSDVNIHTPQIYGAFVAGTGAPRSDGEPVQLSGLAARRATSAARNPTIAVDRLNQQFAVFWDNLVTSASVAREVSGGIFDAQFGLIWSGTPRDLTVEAHGPNSYVRDPKVTHNRISSTYVLGWRESFNPADGSGQTLMVSELDGVVGLTGAPFPFVNQGVAGPLPTEFGELVLEGGWRANGRTFAGFIADKDTKGYFESYGQGFDLAAAVAAPPGVLPRELALGLAPNPFNPRTSIELALPVAGRARIDIYDVRGRLVRKLVDEELAAGTYSRTWSGMDDQGNRVASGVYMVRLRHPGGERVTKAALVE